MNAYVTEELSTSMAPRTVDRYRTAFTLFGRFLADTYDELVTIDELSREMLKAFYDWLKLGRWKRMRSLHTKKRTVNKIEAAWKWLDEQNWHSAVPRPRTLRMRVEPDEAPVSPTFEEMVRCIDACVSDGPRRLATLLFYTGARTDQAVNFRWSDVDLERGTLTVGPQKALPGRVIPLSPHLLAELAGWGKREGRLTGWSVDAGMAQRRLNEAWRRAGVRKEVWENAPGRAFRKGLTSGLKLLGADVETAELYVGRGVAGARARYLDLGHVPFLPIAALIPSIASFRAQQLKLGGVS